MQISKHSTQNLWAEKYLDPRTTFRYRRSDRRVIGAIVGWGAVSSGDALSKIVPINLTGKYGTCLTRYLPTGNYARQRVALIAKDYDQLLIHQSNIMLFSTELFDHSFMSVWWLLLLEVAALLPKDTTCLGWTAAVVFPSSPRENQNQAALKPAERVIIKPCVMQFLPSLVPPRKEYQLPKFHGAFFHCWACFRSVSWVPIKLRRRPLRQIWPPKCREGKHGKGGNMEWIPLSP